MSNLLNNAIGSLLMKEGRMTYICSKHSIFLFAKKSRDHFFSLSEAEQIQIFGKFFDYYWFLYFKKGKKIDFFFCLILLNAFRLVWSGVLSHSLFAFLAYLQVAKSDYAKDTYLREIIY